MSADDIQKAGLPGSGTLPTGDAGERGQAAERRAPGGPHVGDDGTNPAGRQADNGEATADCDIEELFYEGSDLHGEGRYEEAMERFDRCLAIDPNYGDALLGKAMAHLERGEYDAAITLGNRIAELSPDDVLAYTSLSMFYERAGRIKEAEEAGAKARMLDWKRRLATESGE